MSETNKHLGLAFLLFLFPTLCFAQDKPLTLESMNENVRIGDPSFAPDGQEVLFVSNRSGISKVWVIDRDGGDTRRLVDDDGTEAGPAWSPDGSRVAFLRTEAGQPDIWVVDRTSENLRRVTNDAGDERALAWSPDGTRIAFISSRADHQDVYVADVASGTVEQLTEETNPWDDYRWEPAWSPDGKYIAYISNQSAVYDDDLWLVDVETRESQKVTTGIQVVTTPIWSPDGKYIAFNTVPRDGLWYHEMSDIHVVEMPGQTLRQVEMDVYVSDRFSGFKMQWDPNSRVLYFRYEWEGDANLWSVPVDGGIATKMTYEEGRFRNFSLSGDGRSVAYTRSTPTRGGEVYRFDLEGGTPVRLTDWYEPYAGVQAPDKITFRSKDDLYILGYLYLPSAFDASQQYPALVQVHGGGNNAYGNGFHVLEQLMAQQGFVVLAIEYRGGAGHGRAFQDLSLGEFGAEQGWDAVAAAKYLQGLPYTNGKVGIYGGSYGGIMTMAAVTRDSSPFAAAAPFYGIYDWADAYQHADRLARLMILGGHYWYKPGENPALYEHTASIRHLDEVDRSLPFLITHGELDRRAPFQQSERLVEALQAQGNPVEYHWYEGERHGYRKPANRVHAYGRLISFFKEHLATN